MATVQSNPVECIDEVIPHPAEYSAAVIEAFAELLEAGEHVHDPFAGRGLRLGALCDDLGLTFTGTDIESWDGADFRVDGGDSRFLLTYPARPFTTATSPPYINGISSDYKEGPTPRTVLTGRRAYGISKGGPLAGGNLARLVVRSRATQPEFWAGLAACVKNWDNRVLLNVDAPMLDEATRVLVTDGYTIRNIIEVGTPRYRNGANAELRAEHEVVIEAWRRPHG